VTPDQGERDDLVALLANLPCSGARYKPARLAQRNRSCTAAMSSSPVVHARVSRSAVLLYLHPSKLPGEARRLLKSGKHYEKFQSPKGVAQHQLMRHLLGIFFNCMN
jgi:hypothetical protein